jgi:hypothetical protein
VVAMPEPAYFPPVGTASDFMSSAPKSVSGSSPMAARYAAGLKRVFLEHAARAPRTLQQHLGPSELGVECDRQVVGKMAALPATNHVSDPWPSIVGTACHAWAADAFDADNLRTGMLRFVTEQKVTPHPDHPGTADLYDAVEQAVVDHKFLGESSMAKIRKGWPRHYKVQLLLYALGYHLLGLPVRRVFLAAYPRTAASLDGLYVRELEFAQENAATGALEILPENVALIEQVFAETADRRALADRLLRQEIRIEDVSRTPDSDTCFFCPFYRPQAAKDDGPGCPGTAGGSSD